MEPFPRDEVVKMNGLKQRKTNSPFLGNSIPPREEGCIPVLQVKAAPSASLSGICLCTMLNFIAQAVERNTPLVSIFVLGNLSALNQRLEIMGGFSTHQ